MSIKQIIKFVNQLKNSGMMINRIKLVGGEPFMHPNIVEICDILDSAANEGFIGSIKIDTNKTLPYPPIKKSSFIRLSGRHPNKKAHLPILWSPSDIGYQTVGPCQQIVRCGFSLDKFGYLPCSLAIMITRLFGMTHLYRHEFPKKPWGLDQLCPLCIFSMSAEWRRKYTKPLRLISDEEKAPTKLYADSMKHFDVEDFYRKQKVF